MALSMRPFLEIHLSSMNAITYLDKIEESLNRIIEARMPKPMRNTLNRLRRMGRVVFEPDDYEEGRESYTIWTTKRGRTYVTDIWDDGSISYAVDVTGEYSDGY